MSGAKTDTELAGVISSSTQSFNDLSQRINRCESALKDDLDRGDLARMIRRVQDKEKIKLEAVSFFFPVSFVGEMTYCKTVRVQMWEREQGERDFTSDIEDAKRR